MIPGEIEIQKVTWEDAEAVLRSIRTRVFIQEQGVPEELEWDGLDARCVHLVAVAAGEPVGTVRLLPDAHIGRMAVLKDWRNKKVGAALLRGIIDIARKEGMRQVDLNAQTSARGFYEKHGFRSVGGEFMDAGIPHYHMMLALSCGEPK